MEETRRWTGAIWANGSDLSAFKAQIHRLVVGTVLARLSTPASEKDLREQRFDSFDLLFFEEPPQKLIESLGEEGWTSVDVSQLTEDEEERLTVFQNEARREGLAIPELPVALVRLPIITDMGPVEERVRGAARRAGDKLGSQMWGERPGQVSKQLYDELRREVQLMVTPDEAGLAIFEDFLVEQAERALWVPHPVIFQALCDFIGVILQARGDREVQWAPSVIDETTGLADAPLLRARQRQGTWRMLPVGRDIVSRVIVPWAPTVAGERRLVALLEDYIRG